MTIGAWQLHCAVWEEEEEEVPCVGGGGGPQSLGGGQCKIPKRAVFAMRRNAILCFPEN